MPVEQRKAWSAVMAYFKEMEVSKKPRGMGLAVAIQVAKIAKFRVINRRGPLPIEGAAPI